MQVSHKILSHCWVCNQRFSNQVPPGPVNEERHHLMPRAYGGTDGPQVSLCERHHTALHKVATAILARKSFEHLLVGEDLDRRKKILWMASLVVKSKQATVNDENKSVKVFLSLNRDQQRKLAFCMERRGITNKPDAFYSALELMFNTLKG